MESHQARIARQRREYRVAHERFVARLRAAADDAVHRVQPDGGWSVAQIAWHVAAVDAFFAAALNGDHPAAKPVSPGTAERPWTEIVQGIPAKLEAGARVQPPADARREPVLDALAEAAAKIDAALAALSADRAAGFAVTHPAIGVVTLGHIGDWATSHTIRHNAQAKRVLASGP